MRIAQVAPLVESVPPSLYGGTERVVYYLTEELVRMGHDVTLFASGDSRTSARLVALRDKALRLDESVRDSLPHLMLLLGQVFDRAEEFDVIHCHVDFFGLPFTRYVRTPTVFTLHGRLDLPDIAPIFREYAEASLVSVSDNQRKPLPFANWAATVYNGIGLEDHRLGEGKGGYLAFLGRISPEKGVDVAIRVAREVGIPLKIAAKVDAVDKDYFRTEISPLLRGDHVEYVGEVDQEGKNEFLGNALALLFPVQWPEPFGLAMTESMACGTPVIALPRGSVKEVVVHGKTGFICESVQQMVQAISQAGTIDRGACRRHVETKFSSRVMARGYERVYRMVCENALAGVGQPFDGIATLMPAELTESIANTRDGDAAQTLFQ